MNVKKLTIGIVVIAVLAVVLNNFKDKSSSVGITDDKLISSDLLGETVEILVGENGSNKVTIKSTDEGWVLPDNDFFPVDFDRVDRLVKLLSEAKILRFVTDKPERMNRLEMGTTEITLKDKSSKELFHLSIGKRHDKGGNYISVSGRDGVFLVKDAVYADRNFKNWINKDFMKVDSDDIKSFKISFKSDPLLPLDGSRKSKDEEFSSSTIAFDESIKKEQIDGFLDTISELRHSQFKAKDDPEVIEALNNAQTYSLETFDGIKFDLTVGQKPQPPEHREGETEEEHAAHDEKRPVYAVLDFKDSTQSWYKPASKYAFEVYEHNYNALPDKRSSFLMKVAGNTESVETEEAESAN